MALEESLEDWARDLLDVVLRRNPDCAAHSVACARLTLGLGRALGWSGVRLKRLTLGALLHDVGKLAVSCEVLHKTAELSLAERREVERHTVVGAAILGAMALPDLELSAVVARSHHERWDGTGYPDGLREAEVPFAARIVAVADVYDALRRERPYRPAMDEDAALALMREGEGAQFDPEVLRCFLGLTPSFRELAARPGLRLPLAAAAG